MAGTIISLLADVNLFWVSYHFTMLFSISMGVRSQHLLHFSVQFVDCTGTQPLVFSVQLGPCCFTSFSPDCSQSLLLAGVRQP